MFAYQLSLPSKGIRSYCRTLDGEGWLNRPHILFLQVNIHKCSICSAEIGFPDTNASFRRTLRLLPLCGPLSTTASRTIRNQYDQSDSNRTGARIRSIRNSVLHTNLAKLTCNRSKQEQHNGQLMVKGTEEISL